jgi:hypothetical protein
MYETWRTFFKKRERGEYTGKKGTIAGGNGKN